MAKKRKRRTDATKPAQPTRSVSDDAPQSKENAPRAKLPTFGGYLKGLRVRSGLGTQADVLDVLSYSFERYGLTVSQSMIAQYELGRVADPNPLILKLLAEVYRADYLQMVLVLCREKYGVAERDPDSRPFATSQNRWETMCTIAEQYRIDLEQARVKAPDDEEMAEAFSRSRVEQITYGSALDVPGLAHWQCHIANSADIPVREFWVVAPRYIDINVEEFYQATKRNIENGGPSYSYFVYRHDLGRFLENLKGRLVKECNRAVDDDIKAYALDPTDQTASGSSSLGASSHQLVSLLNSPFMIAKFEGFDMQIAYQCVRRHKRIVYGFRLNDNDATAFVDELSQLAIPSNRIDLPSDPSSLNQ